MNLADKRHQPQDLGLFGLCCLCNDGPDAVDTMDEMLFCKLLSVLLLKRSDSWEFARLSALVAFGQWPEADSKFRTAVGNL